MDKFCIRYQVPTNSEKAPYSTICKVIKNYKESTKEEEEAIFYIQISKNEAKPIWIRVGSFLETALRDKLENKRFINKCLRLFEGNSTSKSTSD